MAAEKVIIDSEIKRAETLPASVYTDPACLETLKESLFARSWQLVADADEVRTPGQALPVTMLRGCLDEPILITRDSADRINCLSNVCTHRGAILVEGAGHAHQLRCRYHGRCFALDGRFVSTPGFDAAEDFPRKEDDLPHVSHGLWGKFIFASIDPAFPLELLLSDLERRLGWLPFDRFIFDAGRSRDYLVRANWALYCDNYLEGFHIPYVHPALAASIDVKDYATELFDYSNLQIGVASNPEESFDLPASSPEFGKAIAAYYYWLFPNTMLNFYPWGLSVNIVVPQSVDRTKVSYLTYVLDESKLSLGAGANVDRTEREDEEIVEKVQQGVRSRFYNRGRYSPQHESGVHHFHRLLSAFLPQS